MKDVEKIKQEFFDKIQGLGAKTQFEIMYEVMKLTNWVASLYESGYKDGFEEGSSTNGLDFKDDFLNQNKN